MKLKELVNEGFRYKWNNIMNNDDIVKELKEANLHLSDDYVHSAILSPITSIPFYKNVKFSDNLNKYPLDTLDAIDITINRILVMKSMTVL